MKIEEYGKEHDKTILMLHGANFVHCFGRQYVLSNRFHIIVPHIMGFGDEADRIFDTETCVSELADFIQGLDKKVFLIGFSLGAQLACKLVSEYPHLFYSAIRAPRKTSVFRGNFENAMFFALQFQGKKLDGNL